MMKPCCYILFSENLHKFYVGVSKESLELRLEKHHSGFYGSSKYTSTAKDWALVLTIEVDEFSHAVRIEKKIKSMKSSRYIENLLKYPEMIEKIKSETSN